MEMEVIKVKRNVEGKILVRLFGQTYEIQVDENNDPVLEKTVKPNKKAKN